MTKTTKLVLLLTVLFGMAFSFTVLRLTPDPITCKVCHCHKEQCAASCSEENMCQMRCEKECRGRHEN